MAKREKLSQFEKYQGFKKAVETYKHYLDTSNFIGAYVIAFSMLEDRVNAMYAVRLFLKQSRYPKPQRVYATRFSQRLKYLLSHQDIDQITRNNWMQCANDRNEKLHAAMWNIDEFSKADAENVLRHARLADKARKAQQRKIRGKGGRS